MSNLKRIHRLNPTERREAPIDSVGGMSSTLPGNVRPERLMVATIVAFPDAKGQCKKWLLNLAVSEAFSRKVVSLLREARLEKGLSQNKLAEKCGLSRGAIQHIEKGIRNPTLIVAHAISSALDVPLWSVLKQVDEDREEPTLKRKE